ncbi:MAG: hypothetical protein AAGU32_19175, partial [Bacillota bacterium]
EKDRADHYEAARSLMDDGEYEEAIAAFSRMGEYKDSPEMAVECQNTLDYNAAKALMKGNQFEQARDALTALGSFGDAQALAEECQHTLDYNAAVALMNEGKLDSARDAFLALGDFMDAQEIAAQCQNGIDYDAAVSMMNAGQYAEAMSAFNALGDYSDAAGQAAECQRNIDYFAADEAYQNGFFYTAYVAFSALGDFGDAATRAGQCIQPAPENGELYRNPDFGKKISFTIKNDDKSQSACVKIYTEDGVLVSTVFIRPSSKTKIKLQAGSYRFKEAIGYDWFGDKEYFGASGTYSVMQFEDGELQTLSTSRYYTLTLMLDNGDGNVGGSPETMEGF